MIQGIGAAAGIAIGRAFVLPAWEMDIQERPIEIADLSKEIERLHEGIMTSKHEIEEIRNEIQQMVGKEESTIFDAHIAILEDPAFMSEIRGIIERQYKAAEVAVKEAIDHFVTMFDLLEDEYMKERALDIKDVGNRLLKHLLGTPDITLPKDNQPYILVAKELSPSQLVHLNPSYVLGMVTISGGKTSHSAIMARALGIPLVSGFESNLDRVIQTGDWIVMDGDQGSLFINPAHEVIHEYTLAAEQQRRRKEQLQLLATEEAITKDGVHFHLAANISSYKEFELAVKHGAEGVGLFRTEFIYMNQNSLPTEDQQYEVYRKVVEHAEGNTVVIRTLDIGGDKELDYLDLPKEANPFLGYRAIRISLDRHDLFKTQLTAILRASAHGQVNIMYPMISSLEELRQAKLLLKEAMNELDQRGISYNREIKVGIMIEIPAAAIAADLLARECDFFSIGTNDLVQYVLAVDRMNENIAHMYRPFHPAVLRMLKLASDAAHTHGIPVSVCGELAGDERAIPIWAYLGITHLSMSSQAVLRLKHRIMTTHAFEEAEIGKQCFMCSTSIEVEELLK